MIGLDVHKKECVGFAVHRDVESGESFTVQTTSEGLEAALPRFAGHKVVIEASTSGKAVARFLRDRGVDVDLVQADVLTGHIRYTKSDKLDAKDLARVGLVGGYKTCYIPTSDEEEIRSTVRHIRDLRQHAAGIANQAKAILQRNLVPEPVGNLKHQHVRQRWAHIGLPPAERAALSTKLNIIARLYDEADTAMIALCRLVRSHPLMRVYMTVPGVSVFTAAAIIGFCGDMRRFPDEKRVAAYSGLTPRLHQSGMVARHGRITKRGPNVLRFVLIEAVHTVIRFPGRLGNKYTRLAARIGKGRSIVATARALIVTLWTMAITGRAYEGHDAQLADAKTWRLETVVRLADAGHTDDAKKLLTATDLKRTHDRYQRGTSRLATLA